MTRQITQMKAEEAVAGTEDFLQFERGASIDGGFAANQVAERVVTVEERANGLLSDARLRHPQHTDLYIPLSKRNANDYSEVAAVLPGYMVLVPSTLVERGSSSFYPAVVSEDGLKDGELRLHVLRQPYRGGVGYGASTILSAAGQSETKGVGEHGRNVSDGVEAEHFATLLAASSDPQIQRAWETGNHINHDWRKDDSNSVTTEVSKRIFGSEIPQATITITKQQITDGKAMILWHEGMRDQTSGKPETATKEMALVVVQSLGFTALKERNPQGLDDVKRLIA